MDLDKNALSDLLEALCCEPEADAGSERIGARPAAMAGVSLGEPLDPAHCR